MLQQTTVKAVIPLYLHFMKKFPNLKKLSKAETSDVLASWKGLGYYNRARNIHKAAQILVGYNSFPKTAEELIKLPGFGDYTSRAVSSQAFGEKKGVLDGNVIRVLSRFLNIHTEWWVPKNKSQLQILADTLASTSKNSSHYNQGVMELGATICTPQSPSCLICPVQKNCASFKKGEQSILPLKKKRKEKELWVWEVTKLKTSNSLALTNSSTRPVLKKQWIPTGSWSKVDKKPKSFDIKHNVTHHEIFVRIKEVDEIKAEHTSFPIKNIESHSPFSITQKVIEWKSPT